MYLTGTEGINTINPLNAAIISVIKNNISKLLILNIIIPPLLNCNLYITIAYNIIKHLQ